MEGPMKAERPVTPIACADPQLEVIERRRQERIEYWKQRSKAPQQSPLATD
jgi:hypothetical protein